MKQTPEMTAVAVGWRELAFEAGRRAEAAEAALKEASNVRDLSAHLRIRQLERALEFYADISKYPAPFTGGMGALWADCGEVARTALGSKSRPDQ